MRRKTWQLAACAFGVLLTLPILGCPYGDSGNVDESLVVFTDPDSSLRTNDVYEADDELVRFDPASGSLIWAADGSSFPGYPVDGDLIGPTGFFKVRFGTVEGQRRAYFTETEAETICDIRVDDAGLGIFPTSMTVPQ